MYNQIDFDMYRQDTLRHPEAIIDTIMTRSRAQATTRHGEHIRKEELKLLQDLPTVQKHMIAPGLFQEDGTLIDKDSTQDSELLCEDYVDMQGVAHDDIISPEIDQNNDTKVHVPDLEHHGQNDQSQHANKHDPTG